MTYAGSTISTLYRSPRLSSAYFLSSDVGRLRLTLHPVQVFHPACDGLHTGLTHIMALKKDNGLIISHTLTMKSMQHCITG